MNWLNQQEGIFAQRAQWGNVSADKLGKFCFFVKFSEKISTKHLDCESKRIGSASISQAGGASPPAPLPQRLPRPPRNICGPSMPPRQPFSWEVDGFNFKRFRARGARGALPLTLTCRALSQSLLDMNSLC